MVLAGGLLALTLSGCFGSSSSEQKMEYIAVQTEEDGRWGFWNPDKGLVYADEFKNAPTSVYEGVFVVEDNENGTYTAYTMGDNAPVAIKDCEGLYDAGTCSEGLIPVTKSKSRITLVKKDGSEAFTLTPVKGKEIVGCAASFSDGMLKIETEDEKYGYVDTKGNVVIEPKYDRTHGFKHGMAIVAINSEKDGETTTSWSVIDKKGNVVISLKKGMEPKLIGDDEVIVTYDEERFGLMNKKGEMTKLPSKIKDIASFDKNFIVFEQDDAYGVMDRELQTIIRPKYEYIQILPDNKFLCRREEKVEVIDKDSNIEFTINDYNDGAVYIPGIDILAKDKKLIQAFNLKGELVKNAEFYGINFTIPGSGYVRSDYFNTEGLAKKVAEQFALNGVGGFTFGSTAASVVSGNATSAYTYRSYYDKDDVFKGFRYRANLRLGFTSDMANSGWDSNYDWTYTWNPESKLSAAVLMLYIDTDINKDMIEAIAKALQNKGFERVDKKIAANEQDDSKKYGIRLKKGNTLIAVITEGNNSINIFSVDVPNDPNDVNYINNILWGSFPKD